MECPAVLSSWCLNFLIWNSYFPFLFFFLLLLINFTMNYLILKLPNFLFIMLSISFNLNEMYPPIYSVGFLGFSIANTEWFSVKLLATHGLIYLLILLLCIFIDVSRFSFHQLFIYFVLGSSSFCAMKHNITKDL